MPQTVVTDGLVNCSLCADRRRYTVKGLLTHVMLAHHNRLCPYCGADMITYREIMHAEHNCRGVENPINK